MDITQLKGIGTKTAMNLNRLSVYTVEDLVRLYPRDYIVYEEPVFINSLGSSEKMVAAVEATVVASPKIYGGERKSIISVVVKDENMDTIKCLWYNSLFLKSKLRVGMHYIFRGRIVVKNGEYALEHPDIYTMAAYAEIKNSMSPVYPLTKGLSNKVVTKAVRQAIDEYAVGMEHEFIPEVIMDKYGLLEHNKAMHKIHFPDSMEDYIQARHRIAFEEFFLFVLATMNLKSANERIPNSYIINNDKRTDEFISRLPYTLTNAQLRTWDEIKADMAGKHVTSRLIQGDVGSGKTIIAILALMNTAYAGCQAAMMVPTEVLAKQQFESMTELFYKSGIELKVGLLTGSMTLREKKKVYVQLETGELDIVVGTHALIQEKVIYKKLALVITDEQHRFGVNQRKMFSDKGENPHIIVMSATPIPRTLAIILYGDLDISIIDELPSDRLPIKNCVVDTSYRTKAYIFISRQIKEGRQCYVICPMVEDSENIEAENVIDYSQKLKEAIPDARIDYLHGRMKASEKNEKMEKFMNGDTDVLVSTTVIEVGVNVPNSTVMMVENSERFGLAQLHQLRGRVGRGRYQSYCIFVTSAKSKQIKQRLEILNKSNDGFRIAEEDLKLRGPGDFFGIRQSGDFDFGIADIYTDAKTLKEASESAKSIADGVINISKEQQSALNSKLDEYTIKCLEKINL